MEVPEEIGFDFFDDATDQPHNSNIQTTSSTANHPQAFITPLSSSSSDSSSQSEDDDLHGRNESSEQADSTTLNDEQSNSDRTPTTPQTQKSRQTEDKAHNNTFTVKHVGSYKSRKQYTKKKTHKGEVPYNRSSSDSVTDVSPLSSPAASPTLKRHGQNLPDQQIPDETKVQHITRLNVVFRKNKNEDDSSKQNVPQATENSKQNKACNNWNSIDLHSYAHDFDDRSLSSSDEEYHKPEPKLVPKNHNWKAKHTLDAQHHRKRLLSSSAKESLEISNLLETVLDFEKQKQYQRNRFDDRPGISGGLHRKNMSFSNDQVRHIDHENQRLLKEITKMSARNRSRPSSASSVRSVSTVRSNTSTQSRSSLRSSGSRRQTTERSPKLYHSAINRINYQRQIERENMQLLKRIQAAKPTKGMQRQSQLSEFKKQKQFMGNSVDRNGMSVRRAHELTKNAEVVKDAMGLNARYRPSKPAWQNDW